MILQVESYTDLDTLASDVQGAANQHPEHIFSRNSPMKVEISEKDSQLIKQDLITSSFSNIGGIRSEQEIMSSVFALGPDIYISFVIKAP